MLDESICTIFPYDNNYLLWLTHTTASGKTWYITSDMNRMAYQLWHNKKMTARKSSNPLDLYKYIKE